MLYKKAISILMALSIACLGLNAYADEPETKSFVTADTSFSNLRLDNPTTPVYDSLTLAQRRANGYTTYMPDLTPYRDGKVAYLTFDDGPDDRNTEAVLDILKERGIRATFYLVGAYVDTYPHVVKRIFDEGHAIGNHSYNHNYDTLYSSPYAFISQMEKTDEAIHRIIGYRPLILRAPGGSASSFTRAYVNAVKEAGYAEHDWNASVEDATTKPMTEADYINNVDQHTKSEATAKTAIVLMHCSSGRAATVRALPAIIDLLEAKGYSFGVVTPMTPQPW